MAKKAELRCGGSDSAEILLDETCEYEPHTNHTKLELEPNNGRDRVPQVAVVQTPSKVANKRLLASLSVSDVPRRVPFVLEAT